MDFAPSPRAAELTEAVQPFVRDKICPLEEELRRGLHGAAAADSGPR